MLPPGCPPTDLSSGTMFSVSRSPMPDAPAPPSATVNSSPKRLVGAIASGSGTVTRIASSDSNQSSP